MSNKLELQNNNIDLQGILTKVNTLPKKENIDEEVDTIENLTEQIKLALEGKAAGGNGKIFAAIGVIYPEGSICTCTNGTKTMEAENTNGQWIFAIPAPKTLPETWTITATDGTNTKSQTVSITSEGQFENVKLSYHLIANGVALGEWTLHDAEGRAKVSKVGDYLEVGLPGVYGSHYRAYYCIQVDLTSISTLKANAYYGGYQEDYDDTLPIMYYGTTPTSIAGRVNITNTTAKDISLDVSSCDGLYYVGFSVKNTYGYSSGNVFSQSIYVKSFYTE